jgi:hypothetical protein
MRLLISQPQQYFCICKKTHITLLKSSEYGRNRSFVCFMFRLFIESDSLLRMLPFSMWITIFVWACLPRLWLYIALMSSKNALIKYPLFYFWCWEMHFNGNTCILATNGDCHFFGLYDWRDSWYDINSISITHGIGLILAKNKNETKQKAIVITSQYRNAIHLTVSSRDFEDSFHFHHSFLLFLMCEFTIDSVMIHCKVFDEYSCQKTYVAVNYRVMVGKCKRIKYEGQCNRLIVHMPERFIESIMICRVVRMNYRHAQ